MSGTIKMTQILPVTIARWCDQASIGLHRRLAPMKRVSKLKPDNNKKPNKMRHPNSIPAASRKSFSDSSSLLSFNHRAPDRVGAL